MSRGSAVISKPRNVLLLVETLKIIMWSSFVKNYHPSMLKLLMSISSHRWTGLEWIATRKKLGLNFYNVVALSFPKSAGTDYELLQLSRI